MSRADKSADAESYREAGAVADQLEALVSIDKNPGRAVKIAKAWATGDSGGPPPGGAGFANLLAVARVIMEIDMKIDRVNGGNFDLIRVSPDTIKSIAQQLAQASVADPSDLDVVENLAVLFGYLGDARRRNLALEIAASLKARER